MTGLTTSPSRSARSTAPVRPARTACSCRRSSAWAFPVTGKNVFPSNIQGLPTWYEIRVSKDGYTARPEHVDLVVALNPETYAKDVAAVRPGGYLLYDSSWPLDDKLVREGITILGIPFGKMCVEHFEGDRDRTLLRNIVYVGALAALLEFDMDVVERDAAREVRQEEARCSTPTSRAIRLGYDYAKAHYDCPLPFHLERMDATTGLHPDRRQHRRCARRRLRRRDGRRVVSDHAVDVADGSVQGVLRAVPHRPDDRASASTASSRRRTSSPPRAW